MYSRNLNCAVLAVFLALMAVCSVQAVAVVPPVALEAHPAPVSYPDQLHPIDVVEMSGEVSPAVDPCPWPQSPKERARCWMEAAFPESEWAAAWHVVSHESAHTYDPAVRNYEGSDAWGLWQNRERFWDERVRLFFPEFEMNIFDGWHSTLIASRVAGAGQGYVAWGFWGWHHFDTCAESNRYDKRPFRFEIECGPGRWLR